MENARIYIKIWNADTDQEEWRPFSTKDAVDLLEPDEDPDALAYAMGQADNEAFYASFEHFDSVNVFTYEKFVDYFLSITDKDIYVQ